MQHISDLLSSFRNEKTREVTDASLEEGLASREYFIKRVSTSAQKCTCEHSLPRSLSVSQLNATCFESDAGIKHAPPSSLSPCCLALVSFRCQRSKRGAPKRCRLKWVSHPTLSPKSKSQCTRRRGASDSTRYTTTTVKDQLKDQMDPKSSAGSWLPKRKPFQDRSAFDQSPRFRSNWRTLIGWK